MDVLFVLMAIAMCLVQSVKLCSAFKKRKIAVLTSIIEEIILNKGFFKYCIPYYSNFYSRHASVKGQILLFSLLFLTKKYWLRTCFLIMCSLLFKIFYSIADYSRKCCILFRFYFWGKNVDWELALLYCAPYYASVYSIHL